MRSGRPGLERSAARLVAAMFEHELSGLERAIAARRALLQEEQRELEQRELEQAGKGIRELVEERIVAGGCFRLELVRCGKTRCRCATFTSSKHPRTVARLHGPYWYAYMWSARTRKVVHTYIGKPGSPAATARGL